MLHEPGITQYTKPSNRHMYIIQKYLTKKIMKSLMCKTLGVQVSLISHAITECCTE